MNLSKRENEFFPGIAPSPKEDPERDGVKFPCGRQFPYTFGFRFFFVRVFNRAFPVFGDAPNFPCFPWLRILTEVFPPQRRCSASLSIFPSVVCLEQGIMPLVGLPFVPEVLYPVFFSWIPFFFLAEKIQKFASSGNRLKTWSQCLRPRGGWAFPLAFRGVLLERSRHRSIDIPERASSQF